MAGYSGHCNGLILSDGTLTHQKWKLLFQKMIHLLIVDFNAWYCPSEWTLQGQGSPVSRPHSLPVYLKSKQSLINPTHYTEFTLHVLDPCGKKTFEGNNVCSTVVGIVHFINLNNLRLISMNLGPGCLLNLLVPQLLFAGQAPKTKGPWGTPNWTHHSCHPGPERIGWQMGQ